MVVLCITISHWRELCFQRTSQRIGNSPRRLTGLGSWSPSSDTVKADHPRQERPCVKQNSVREKYLPTYLQAQEAVDFTLCCESRVAAVAYIHHVGV